MNKQNGNRPTDIENTLMIAKGEGVGEWEFVKHTRKKTIDVILRK